MMYRSLVWCESPTFLHDLECRGGAHCRLVETFARLQKRENVLVVL
jgi:hypothetical protein